MNALIGIAVAAAGLTILAGLLVEAFFPEQFRPKPRERLATVHRIHPRKADRK